MDFRLILCLVVKVIIAVSPLEYIIYLHIVLLSNNSSKCELPSLGEGLLISSKKVIIYNFYATIA